MHGTEWSTQIINTQLPDNMVFKSFTDNIAKTKGFFESIADLSSKAIGSGGYGTVSECHRSQCGQLVYHDK